MTAFDQIESARRRLINMRNRTRAAWRAGLCTAPERDAELAAAYLIFEACARTALQRRQPVSAP